MPAAHRHDDIRKCGAVTNVVGQSTTFVNGKLWAVIGDPNSHGAGALIPSGSTVFIQGKKVIVNAPDSASPDNLCPTEGGLHCEPLTHQGAVGTFAYGPGGEGVGGVIPTPVVRIPSAANLVLSAAAPIRAHTDNIWLTASAADLALSGKVSGVAVADLNVTRTVPFANLSLSSTAPLVEWTAHHWVTVGAANLALSVDSTIMSAGAGLAISTTAPLVEWTAHQWVTAGSASVGLSTAAPLVQRTAHQWVTAGSASVGLSTAAPLVVLTYNGELREDGSIELREDGSRELRE